MDKKKYFCNVPWLEVKINADGSYQTCGAQRNVISYTSDKEKYNVFNLSIKDWINSDHQARSRLGKVKGQHDNLCQLCYSEESVGSTSKRIRELHKSFIKIEQFDYTYNKSPYRLLFEYSLNNNGLTDNLVPNSYHLSIGNECNLACRFCSPHHSSKIAVERIQEGSYTGPAKMNWTENTEVWNRITDEICKNKELKFLHIIGGETLLNPKFENLIDKLIEANNTDIYVGFTTNGTLFSQTLMEKLNQFRHVDIGISVETADRLNDYIRKGSDTPGVLTTIENYNSFVSESHIYVTVRPVPSALSVHRLDGLYQWCVDRKIDVMTNILSQPAHLQIQSLPRDIKNRLLEQYNKWVFTEPLAGNWDPRDPNRFKEHIDNEIRSIINALQQDNNPDYTRDLYNKLKLWGWLDDPYTSKFFETNFR